MSFKVIFANSAEEAAKFSALEDYYKGKLKNGEKLEVQEKPVHERLGYVKPRNNYNTARDFEERRNFGGKREFRSRDRKPYARRSNNDLMLSSCYIHNGASMLGDSIMVRAMKYASTNNNTKKTILCQGGMTSKKLDAELTELSEFRPKVVTISIGGNDVLQGISLPEISKNIEGIVGKLSERGAEKIRILAVAPMAKFGTNSEVNWAINRLNNYLQTLSTEESKIEILDTYSIFYKNGYLQKDLYERFYWSGKVDLIHPNQQGLQKILNVIDRASSCE